MVFNQGLRRYITSWHAYFQWLVVIVLYIMTVGALVCLRLLPCTGRLISYMYMLLCSNH